MAKDKIDEEIGSMEIEEISPEAFEKLAEGTANGKVDYEELWKLLEGKIMTSATFNKQVNVVRKAAGLTERELYYSERKRVFEGWEKQGRQVQIRVGTYGKKRMNVYKFVAP
jgi:hypothetical protein